MTYSELQDYAEKQKLTIKEVADRIGMSRVGMKSSFEHQTLQIKKVNELCNMLGISPNTFFGWKDTPHQFQNGGFLNTQNFNNYADPIELFRNELAIKNEQLKVKDEQIASLLALLKK